MWVENEDPLEAGVKLPRHVIDQWRRPAAIHAWQHGGTLRQVAQAFGVSHETVRIWVAGMTRPPRHRGRHCGRITPKG